MECAVFCSYFSFGFFFYAFVSVFLLSSVSYFVYCWNDFRSMRYYQLPSPLPYYDILFLFDVLLKYGAIFPACLDLFPGNVLPSYKLHLFL